MFANVGPWCCLGDSNVVIGAHECRGGRIPQRGPTEEFNSFTKNLNLIHLVTMGADFTWTNKRRGAALIERRLDRALCNDSWIDGWSQVACCSLPRIASDHNPTLLCSHSDLVRRSSSFKFQKMWLHHVDCRRIIEESWALDVVGFPMYVLAAKLKRLKVVLKDWNFNIFGNIHHRVKDAKADLETIQSCINDLGPDHELLDQEAIAQTNLFSALLMEEKFWKEKSRLNWHCSGDRNTSFFHKVTKIRQVSKSLSMLKVDEEILTDQEDIASHVLNYYIDLFACPNNSTPNSLIQEVVPSLVHEEENQNLTKMPDDDEIRTAVFALNGDGAPGPDGYGGCFYQSFWNIIKHDVCNSVKQFFSQSWLMPNMNSNMVILIPKSTSADRIEDFRPIALANF
ncbi:PREDICTED: uncharacterized protein LOC109337507 [Lupinus angustifolius]|uniref:uncharacterized protein LOC109337507 n=1 Tax=Lupinus angustifolius TaxID=3871 RepID=UPI00092EB0BB|nr:PREDICTED: uncharacterized protein LOC109337507 [Lupinus angustifolius]